MAASAFDSFKEQSPPSLRLPRHHAWAGRRVQARWARVAVEQKSLREVKRFSRDTGTSHSSTFRFLLTLANHIFYFDSGCLLGNQGEVVLPYFGSINSTLALRLLVLCHKRMLKLD